VLLGDILYHGPRNDLPEGYAPKKVIAMLNEVKDELLCVRGNCDTEVDQMVLEFPILADYAILYAGGRMIYATHGHVYNEGKLPPLKKGDVLLHGHTHVPKCTEHENYLYINPGSVSIPKEGSAHSYLILEDGILSWKALDGEIYMSYTL
jgi:putative phosphoesterase